MIHTYQILISVPIIIAAKFSYRRNHDVFKIHIRRHFPRVGMGWRPLARVCLWLHANSCLHSTRRRYIVSINMASVKASHCQPIPGIQIILFLDRFWSNAIEISMDVIIFQLFFSETNLLQGNTVPLMGNNF